MEKKNEPTQQDEIDLCLACTRRKCEGECDALQALRRKKKLARLATKRANPKLHAIWTQFKNHSKHYKVTMYTPWVHDFDAFMKWAKENGYTEGKRIVRKHWGCDQGFTPSNLKIM